MPISAYLRAVALLICAAAALFASAGSFAILNFWLYLVILGLVFIISFVMLDRGLLQERMRPGGRPIPLALRLLNLVLFVHWIIAGLDRGRLHLSDTVPPWLQAAGFLIIAAGYALVFWAMQVNRFASSVVRIQSDRGQYVGDARTLCVDPSSSLCRRLPNYRGKWCRARFVARGRFSCRHRLAVPAVSSNHRRSFASSAIARLRRLRAAG
jgi:hypothetical protein